MLDSDDPCVHWWVLDSPDGHAFVAGTCKKCKAVRDDFRASGDDDKKHWVSHVPGMQRAPVTYIFEV